MEYKKGDKIRLKTRFDLNEYFKEEEEYERADDENDWDSEGPGAYYFYNRNDVIFYPYKIMGKEFTILGINHDGFFHVSGDWYIHKNHCYQYTKEVLPDKLFEV